MTKVYEHNGGYRAEIYFRSRLHKLWLGKCRIAQAKAAAGHIEQLKIASDLGGIPPASTMKWLSLAGPRIKKKLSEFGLVSQIMLPTTIGEFCDDYIRSRTDWVRQTELRMTNVRKHLCSQLGESRQMLSVTVADAEAFGRWARMNFNAASHSGKVISDSRQFFAAAVKARVISENPFDGINSSQPIDETRKAYVSEELIDSLIHQADPYLGALLATARYGGLRVPSEPLALEWDWIDWEGQRIRVWDQKRKKEKELPLFPKWGDALKRLERDDPRYVFGLGRSSANRSWRKRLCGLLKRTGTKQWPKLWHTLRASRETDLKEIFPGHHHVVHSWIGNTEAVSKKHYDRVHDEHYDRALGK